MPLLPAMPTLCIVVFGHFYKLTETVTEQDICGLVLSVDARVCRQPYVDTTGVDRVFMAEGSQPSDRVGKSKPPSAAVATAEVAAVAGPTEGGSVGVLTSAAVAAARMDQDCLFNVVASKEMHKSALPELLRLQEIIER